MYLSTISCKISFCIIDTVDTLLQDEDSNFEENPKETKRFNEMFSRSLRSQQHSAGPLEMWTRSLRYVSVYYLGFRTSGVIFRTKLQ